MRFELLDAVLELSDDRIVTIKHVTAGEEYLQDHFPGFPVLPGVLMVEAMVQAARRLIGARESAGCEPARTRYVLGALRAFKYGAMVRPGDTLRIEVAVTGAEADGAWACRASATVLRPASTGPGATAAGGRLVMRPVRLARASPG